MKNLAADREIAAIIPEYTALGDGTLLYESGGRQAELSVKVDAVLTALITRRCEDIRLLRKWAGKYTHQKLWTPLAISWELVLVPFKLRRPRISGDATVGYFNFEQIEGIRVEGSETRLCLRSGQKFRLLWNLATAEQHLQNAFLIQAMLTNFLDDVLLHRMHLLPKKKSERQKNPRA